MESFVFYQCVAVHFHYIFSKKRPKGGVDLASSTQFYSYLWDLFLLIARARLSKVKDVSH